VLPGLWRQQRLWFKRAPTKGCQQETGSPRRDRAGSAGHGRAPAPNWL